MEAEMRAKINYKNAFAPIPQLASHFNFFNPLGGGRRHGFYGQGDLFSSGSAWWNRKDLVSRPILMLHRDRGLNDFRLW